MNPKPDITIYRILPMKSSCPIRVLTDRQEAENVAKLIAPNIAIEMDAYELYSKPRRQIVHYSQPSEA